MAIIPPITWKSFVYSLVINHCENSGLRTFTLQDFISVHAETLQNFRPTNKHWKDKVRQQLQFLRNDDLLYFADNRGTYTLKNFLILKDEVEDSKIGEVLTYAPEKREYLIETFARNRGWVKLALNHFGDLCLCEGCANSFIKANNSRYIEVHHVIPLCEGGEDALWNLSVLCAHHHRMAHFADDSTKFKLRDTLLGKVASLIL